ncbi:hypothetical protein NC651_039444 [Populus alba x Populus x berolinensis]|nr:hypothetical protein NC651_039444 [Populus alba x Populus x berolinensis]
MLNIIFGLGPSNLRALRWGKSSLSKNPATVLTNIIPSHKHRKQRNLPHKPYYPQPQLPSITLNTQTLTNYHGFHLQCYFENFPSWVDYHKLKDRFRKQGKVIKLFVSRKTNQAGKHFGFITILSNLSNKTLLECLNDIWFDSYKLRVNVAKHRRKDEVMKQKTVGTGKQISMLNNKAKAPICVRDNRSYLEAVRSGSQVYQESDNATPRPHNFISFNTTDEGILLLRNSLICKISQGAIISFDGEKSIQQAMQKGMECWKLYFNEVRPWMEEDVTESRLAWISISHFPISGWSLRCISNLLMNHGRVIGFDKTNLKISELHSVKILIRTHLPEIHDSIDLMLNSKLVHIQLDEIDPLRYLEAKGISYSMAEFQTTLLHGEDADSDSDDEEMTSRLAIADKNCGADDKAHTLEARKHNPHGTYEVYNHSFAATINATDNTERIHIVVEDLFPEIAAPRTPHHCFSTNKLSQNQLEAERGLVLYDVNSASPLEHPSMAFKRDSFSPQPYTPVSSDDSFESQYKIQSLPLTSNQHRTPTAKQPRLKKISSTGSLLSLHSSASISSIDSYIRVNNTRNLKEYAAESSHNEVNKMIHLGEALGLAINMLEEKCEEEGLTGQEQEHLDFLLKDRWVRNNHIESIWRQKSRQMWCKLGDKNNKFFHLIANFKKAKSSILKIHYNGSTFDSQQGIK